MADNADLAVAFKHARKPQSSYFGTASCAGYGLVVTAIGVVSIIIMIIVFFAMYTTSASRAGYLSYGDNCTILECPAGPDGK